MGYKSLAYSIILQAVIDYRRCKKRSKPTKELENFFKSEWCDVLLGCVKSELLSGERILKALERGKEVSLPPIYKKPLGC